MPKRLTTSIASISLLLIAIAPAFAQKTKPYKLGDQADFTHPIRDTFSSQKTLADGITSSQNNNLQKELTSSTKTDQSKPDRAVWDAWQKALSEELYAKVQRMLKEVGPPENERDFFCKLRWRIYQHGRVIPMSIEGTDSELFRGIVRKALDSMQTSTLIKFPAGYTKEYTEKKSTLQFWWRNPQPGESVSDLAPDSYTPPLQHK